MAIILAVSITVPVIGNKKTDSGNFLIKDNDLDLIKGKKYPLIKI